MRAKHKVGLAVKLSIICKFKFLNLSILLEYMFYEDLIKPAGAIA